MSELFTNKILLSLLLLLNLDFINSASDPEQDEPEEDAQVYNTKSYANNDDDDDEGGDIVEKPFSCGVCNKNFNYNSYLKRHMRTHTEEKPFKCGVCNQRFSLNSNLTIHMRTHTGEKPFSCDVCGQCFGLKFNLISHKRIHTGEKPFECKECCKRFNQISNLTRHIRTHTGEKPFSCGVCNKRFNDSFHLARHMKVHEQVPNSVPPVLMLGSNEMDIISGLDCLDFMCSKCSYLCESEDDLKIHELLRCTGI